VNAAPLTPAQAQFDRAYPWAVKSVRQSRLLQAWLEQRVDGGPLPALAEFGVINGYLDQAELTIYDVVRSHTMPRYQIAKEGSQFGKAFATTGHGRFLDEVIPQAVWRGTKPNFEECVRQGLPIYCELAAFEFAEQNVVYERLLLPFGLGTSEVTSIVSALKTTSWANVAAPLANLSGGAPKYSFRAVIGRDGGDPEQRAIGPATLERDM
jgi:hypothetical protein